MNFQKYLKWAKEQGVDKLVLFKDGHGFLTVDGERTFEFETLAELVEHVVPPADSEGNFEFPATDSYDEEDLGTRGHE